MVWRVTGELESGKQKPRPLLQKVGFWSNVREKSRDVSCGDGNAIPCAVEG